VPRHLFGGGSSDAAENIDGSRVPGAVGTVWDGPTESATQIFDLLDANTQPIQSLVADSQGMVPHFYGPDGVDLLYVDFGAGRIAMTPVDTALRITTHEQADDPHGDRAYADETFVKAADVPWITDPNRRAEAPGVYVPAGWGQFWRAKRDATELGGKAVVAVLGGSSEAGFYTSSLMTTAWPGVLASTLQSTYGDGGSGFYSALVSAQGIAGSDSSAITQWTTSGGLIGQTGTWSVGGYSAGPGWGYLYSNSPGSTLTFTVRGSSITVYTLGADGAHSPWSYTVDGGSAVTVPDSSSSGLSVLTKTITGLASGTHTITIKHTGTSSQYLSVFGVGGERDAGVVVNNFAVRGGTAETYLGSLRAPWNGGPAYPADLLIYTLSPGDVINGLDPDVWASRVRQFFTAVRDSGSALGDTDLVLVLPHIGRADFFNQCYQDFVDRAHGLAFAYGAALVNLWGMGRNSWNYWNSLGYWGSPSSPGASGSDALYMSDAGHAHVAGVINSLLSS
jgi:hypothetical protein